MRITKLPRVILYTKLTQPFSLMRFFRELPFIGITFLKNMWPVNYLQNLCTIISTLI